LDIRIFGKRIGDPLTASQNTSPRLKSLELQGYKTFVSKTPFDFAPTITAIVGPNGSGKSNVADSIRWVLGEQSYSLLRGKRTEDMIFSGSETRPRAGMASATITFDNSEGWLPIEFTEVTISRRAYRDGKNEYLLNGQRVRLRDVLELIASCGLAQRTYTIIGQGLVDAALSLKAEERRKLFEEAAGIGLYRRRREESLKRLTNTLRNLERAQDILMELRPRLRSLERQAKRADTYGQVRKDLQAALRVWYGFHWYSMLDAVDKVREQAAVKSEVRDTLLQKQAAAEDELATTRRRIDELRSQLHTRNQQVLNLHGEREVLGRRLAVSQERLRWLIEQEALIQSEISSQDKARVNTSERLAHILQDVESKRQELMDVESESSEVIKAGETDPSQRQTLHDRARDARVALENLTAEQSAWATKHAQLGERLEALYNKRAEFQMEEEAATTAVSDAQENAQACRMALDEMRRDHQTSAEEVAVLSKNLDRIHDDNDRQLSQLAELKAQRAGLEARLEVLRTRSDEIDRVVGLLDGAALDGQLSGLVGRLDERLQVPSEHQIAISAALSDFSGAVTFETMEDVFAAWRWLERVGNEEHVALLPLKVNPHVPPLELPSDPDVVGNASRLVKAPQKYRPMLDLILGRTLVISDGEAAERILTDLSPDTCLVTIEGDLFFSTGQVILGGGSQEQVSREAMQRIEATLGEVNRNLEAVETEYKRISGEINAAKQNLVELQQAVERGRDKEQVARLRDERANLELHAAEHQLKQLSIRQQSLEEEIHKLEGERDLLEGSEEGYQATRTQLENEFQSVIALMEREEPSLEKARLETRLEIVGQVMDEMDRRRKELVERIETIGGDIKARADRLETNRAEQVSLRDEVSEGDEGMQAIEEQLAALSNQLEPIEQELMAAEQARSAMESEESQARYTLRTSEREHSDIQIELARREEELISLKRRVEDDFGMVAFDYGSSTPGQEQLPLEGLVERLPKVKELPLELEEQVNRLRAQLRRMGAVNPEAQREYEEVRERTNFLTTQVDDLRKAESQIQEVITELDLLMEREFRKTFDAVSVAFREAFTRLFGGGSARLVLTDPNDMTQSGIDIEARLPGRREQGLAVLSGGERSLTACALIFALLKVSPTPFCVLDEVDAMLDDANVIRYCEMLSELSQKTQFILITHNRLTVQAAEVVYGVSLEADSVSRVVSLNLDEVEQAIAT
jgi:chromosome segregation protein